MCLGTLNILPTLRMMSKKLENVILDRHRVCMMSLLGEWKCQDGRRGELTDVSIIKLILYHFTTWPVPHRLPFPVS